MQVGEAQHSEIGFLISTDDASWETGHKHIEIGFSISTDDASWGNGHNTGTGGKSAYNNMQVGGATT